MSSHWLVAVPNEKKGRERAWKNLESASSLKGLSNNYQFKIPDLKVGTLDSLMGLSDDIAKYDALVGSVAKKVEKTHYEIYTSELTEKKEPHQLMIGDFSAKDYVEKFSWNKNRYNTAHSLRQLADSIMKEAGKADDILKKQLVDYNETRTAYTAIERRDAGSLLVKPLSSYIKKQDLVEGDYLTTVMVVVPRAKELEFLNEYETAEIGYEQKMAEEKKKQDDDSKEPKPVSANLEDKKEKTKKKKIAECRNVVPRSAKKLCDEASDENVLFRVVVMRKGLDSFKNICRDKRWTVRPFKFDPDEDRRQKEQKDQLVAKKKQQRSYLIRWCQTNYTELFSSWIHLKAIRLYIEAILRYGLPVDFTAGLLLPHPNKEKQLRESLGQLYNKLDRGNIGTGAVSSENAGAEADIGGFGAEFYPYVYLPLSIHE